MLIDVRPDHDTPSLHALLSDADRLDTTTSFGDDIDAAHHILLSPQRSHEERCNAFLEWVSRYQPCLFGRLGARSMKGIGIDICWIDEKEIAIGDAYLTNKIQLARRSWKNHAAEGDAHGFIIMFNGMSLSHIGPGNTLIRICEKISNLYLIEHAHIQRDTVYTESLPLRHNGLKVFKAGVNIFYPAAHRTRNHDRRVPGGLMISVNSPGHWANSLVKKGITDSIDNAVNQAMEIALRSIGNGGIGLKGALSSSWHNLEECPHLRDSRRNRGRMPRSIPDNHSQRSYSALYHTDILVPTDVTAGARLDIDMKSEEVWPNLVLDYISEQEQAPDHINYALFQGHPIPEEAVYHNPWPPRRAINHRPDV